MNHELILAKLYDMDLVKIKLKQVSPWNNEPAPFGSLSAIFWGKYFWGQKIFFLRGKIFFVGKNEFF